MNKALPYILAVVFVVALVWLIVRKWKIEEPIEMEGIRASTSERRRQRHSTRRTSRWRWKKGSRRRSIGGTGSAWDRLSERDKDRFRALAGKAVHASLMEVRDGQAPHRSR